METVGINLLRALGVMAFIVFGLASAILVWPLAFGMAAGAYILNKNDDVLAALGLVFLGIVGTVAWAFVVAG